jgi:hypothetical protein
MMFLSEKETKTKLSKPSGKGGNRGRSELEN